MRSKKRIMVAFGLALIIVQIFLFRNYLLPSASGLIKVKGLVCTCPDETVLEGEEYLKSITPDSLKKYDFDYSEIYVSNGPSNPFDPMSVGEYWIKGEVIGKKLVYEKAPWNPLLKVESWKELNPLLDRAVLGLILFELLLFGLFFWKTWRAKLI